jgi:hypothetical protein
MHQVCQWGCGTDIGTWYVLSHWRRQRLNGRSADSRHKGRRPSPIRTESVTTYTTSGGAFGASRTKSCPMPSTPVPEPSPIWTCSCRLLLYSHLHEEIHV